jgi:hypothetical protein
MEVTPAGLSVVTFPPLDPLFTGLDNGLFDGAGPVAIINEVRASLTNSQDAQKREAAEDDLYKS